MKVMEFILECLNWVLKNRKLFLGLTIEHLQITLYSISIATLIGVPIGILITRFPRVAKAVIAIANWLYTIPSIAMFGLMIPFLGIGFKPAITALVLYAQFVLIAQTYVGIINVDRFVLEAGIGMGMTDLQILSKVELPLAFPVIISGIRISTTLTIGIVAIAAYIGAGGLGVLIFRGIMSSNPTLMVVGATPIVLLSILSDILLGAFERWLTPKGLKYRGLPG